MLELIYLFLIYSFLGWVLEVIYHVTTDGKFINRGFLIGPYCPIYGFGMLLILYILNPFLDNIFILFLLSVIITTILEFIGGFLLEYFFNQRWWDYSDIPFNIKGYVCLKFSLLWGIGALFSVKFIHVIVKKIYLFMPKYITLIFIIVYFIIIIIDLLITIKKMLGIEKELEKLEELDNKILEITSQIGEVITEVTLKQMENKDKLIEKFESDYKRVLKAFPNIKSKKYGRISKYIKERKNKK